MPEYTEMLCSPLTPKHRSVLWGPGFRFIVVDFLSKHKSDGRTKCHLRIQQRTWSGECTHTGRTCERSSAHVVEGSGEGDGESSVSGGNQSFLKRQLYASSNNTRIPICLSHLPDICSGCEKKEEILQIQPSLNNFPTQNLSVITPEKTSIILTTPKKATLQ